MPAINLRLDDSTHRALKIRAIEQGSSVQSLVVQWLLADLEKPMTPLTAEQIIERRAKKTA